MANLWLRLWHDMPTDPKWRTIARVSGEPIGIVQAVYLHLLVDASRNVTRGHATVTQEDLSSALDVTEAAIASILNAMQGRVLDEMRLLGWDARQPKREDSGDENSGAKSSAQRKAEQRERDKQADLGGSKKDESQQRHEPSRNVTLDKEEKRVDKEEEKKEKSAVAPHLADLPEKLLQDFLVLRKAKKAGALTETAMKGIAREGEKAGLSFIETVTACCEYGWQGFNAQWYADRHQPKSASKFPDKNVLPPVSTVWHESAAGVIAKAAELDLPRRDEVLETFPAFKSRVLAAVNGLMETV